MKNNDWFSKTHQDFQSISTFYANFCLKKLLEADVPENLTYIEKSKRE